MGKPDEEKEKKKKETEDGSLKKKDKKKKKNKKEEKSVDEIVNEVRDPADKSSDTEEEEAEFWMPPEGERWDHDDGGDRWGDDSDSSPEDEEVGEQGISLVSIAEVIWIGLSILAS